LGAITHALLAERAFIGSARSIELEHCTIPPYLCALYSLKDGENLEAAQIIRSVVMEEMLHIVLAANVLNAVGGSPDLCHEKFVPEYPTFLPHSDKAFKVSLEKFSKDALETFLKIEKPKKKRAEPQAHRYRTIGQFYAAIEQGLKTLSKDLGEKKLFSGDPHKQVLPRQYYGGLGSAIPVTDRRHVGPQVQGRRPDEDPLAARQGHRRPELRILSRG